MQIVNQKRDGKDLQSLTPNHISEFGHSLRAQLHPLGRRTAFSHDHLTSMDMLVQSSPVRRSQSPDDLHSSERKRKERPSHATTADAENWDVIAPTQPAVDV